MGDQFAKQTRGTPWTGGFRFLAVLFGVMLSGRAKPGRQGLFATCQRKGTLLTGDL